MNFNGIHVSPDLLQYLIIPLLIFTARITDVSISTVRIIMVSRGNRRYASLLGFFEGIIWVIAISQVIQNCLAIGVQTVQIITEENLKALSMLLREEGFGVTNLRARGQAGDMDFIHVVTPRKRTKELLKIVNEFNPRGITKKK